MEFNTVEEALEELRNGKIILVFYLCSGICDNREY